MLPEKNKETVPFFDTNGERESIFISLFNAISSGLIEKHCGESIEASVIWNSAELRPLWREFRNQAKEGGWDAVKKLTGKAAVIVMFREMITTMALKIHANTKPEYVYSTAEFIRLSKNCDLIFDSSGGFIEYRHRFEAFLSTYNIN
jgi:hypothetical protein